MGITPINVTRVSQNLRAFNLLNTVRANQLGLFRMQNQLATGLRFSAPSEDPTRAADALRLDRRMDILHQVQNNLVQVNALLSESESAMQDAVDLIMEAHTLALEAVSDTCTPDERTALCTVVDALLEQTVAVANRQHLDTFLFSGHFGADAPFGLTADSVLFRGDDGRLQTILDSDLSESTFTISGMEFFDAVSQAVQGFVDLDPALTRDTRISDLHGATGSGVTLGRIRVSDGTEEVEIDLSGADTIGDLLDKLNAELPETLEATLTARAINISSSRAVQITITDVAGGNSAIQLGIYTDTPASSVLGKDLDPKLTPRTVLTDLYAGAGVDLSAGLQVRVGDELSKVSFAGAETLEDVLNRLNQASTALFARICEDGKTIEVLNRSSGSELRIGENGSDVATALGIRSLYAGTLLSELNDGRGVDSVDGDDIRITTADGSQIDADVNDIDLGTATVQDLIDLLNTRGGGMISASLAGSGNGLQITDNTTGLGTLRIERLNLSPAIDGLGLNVTTAGAALVGEDVNPVKVDSPFTALLELRQALQADDSQAISAAGERLSRNLRHMQEVQGELAATAATMLERADRIEDETTATRVLQSDVRDVDMAEAIVRLQQVQTALEANLATASRIINLSLLDYLG